MWQHVQLYERIHPWDTPAWCWSVFRGRKRSVLNLANISTVRRTSLWKFLRDTVECVCAKAPSWVESRTNELMVKRVITSQSSKLCTHGSKTKHNKQVNINKTKGETNKQKKTKQRQQKKKKEMHWRGGGRWGSGRISGLRRHCTSVASPSPPSRHLIPLPPSPPNSLFYSMEKKRKQATEYSQTNKSNKRSNKNCLTY